MKSSVSFILVTNGKDRKPGWLLRFGGWSEFALSLAKGGEGSFGPYQRVLWSWVFLVEHLQLFLWQGLEEFLGDFIVVTRHLA